jgi:hypothetical protein
MGMPTSHRKSAPPVAAPSVSADPPPSRTLRVPEASPPPQEIGGFKGPEPTRFGDWEKNGRCIDF